jgi:acyl-CoA dehydrogenase
MNEESRLVEETARRTISDALTTELFDAAEQGSWLSSIWTRLEEQGLLQPSLIAPGDDPGDALEIEAAIIRAAASTALPLPLVETALAGSLLAQQGFEAPAKPLSLASFDSGDDLTIRAERVGGRLKRVPWGRDVSAVVALASGRLVLLDAKSADIIRGANFAGEPRDTLTFDDTQPLLAGPPVDRELMLARCAAARAVQLSAAAARALEITVEYATQRNQFGRPIGNFQAIQHQLAASAGEVASARVAAQQAYLALASEKNQLFACAVAKARASDASGLVARTAHQVHGAIGYTREYQLQRFTRRIQAWRGEFGSSAFWSRRLGEMVLADKERSLWEIVTGGI